MTTYPNIDISVLMYYVVGRQTHNIVTVFLKYLPKKYGSFSPKEKKFF